MTETRNGPTDNAFWRLDLHTKYDGVTGVPCPVFTDHYHCAHCGMWSLGTEAGQVAQFCHLRDDHPDIWADDEGLRLTAAEWFVT